MVQMTPGHPGEPHSTMTDIEQKLDAIRREQAELAEEIGIAKTENDAVSGGFRHFFGGPLADPADVHVEPGPQQT